MATKKTTVSIVQGNSRLTTSNFRVQDYERAGVSNDEIQEIKEAFDLFDPSRTGRVHPFGTTITTQNCNQLLHH